MKIGFIPTGVSGVFFYRVWQNAEYLRKLNQDVAVLWYKKDIYEYHPWMEDLLNPEYAPKIIDDVDKLFEWADVVVVMALHSTASLELIRSMKYKHNKKLVVDIDDNVFSVPEYNVASTAFNHGSAYTDLFLQQIAHSDAMVVSTPFLKEVYSKYIKNVEVIENSIDLKRWRWNALSPNRHRLNIGYVAGLSHSEDLKMVQPVIFELLDKYKHLRFVSPFGAQNTTYKEHPHCKIMTEFTDIHKYPRFVSKAKMDIGIAPLVDNNFNRSKSNLRWLEYSAAGIPTVASSVSHFKESITHGENGFLCETLDDWKNCLTHLIESQITRTTMGKTAKNTIKKEWNPSKMALKYLKFLKELCYGSQNKVRPS